MSQPHLPARQPGLDRTEGRARREPQDVEESGVLMLEDLLDDPIELTLSDFAALDALPSDPSADLH